MNRQFLDRGRSFSGADFERFAQVPPHGRVSFDGFGNMVGVSLQDVFTHFQRPPAAAVTTGTELDLITISTGTVQIATQPTAKGGCNIKTRSASIGTDGDLAGLKPALTTNSFNVPIRAGSLARFATRIAIGQIVKEIAFAGLDQNITRFDPTATANDGCGFLFCDDATQLVSNPGLVAGATNPGGVLTVIPATPYANWICTLKVAGVDTFIATKFPVQAAVDYELVLLVGDDLKPSYYINGELVGKGVTALGANTLATMIGVEIGGDDTGAGGIAHDIDIRYVSLSRGIGA